MLEKVRQKESEERDLASVEREEAEERKTITENGNDENAKKVDEEKELREENMGELWLNI